MSKVRRSNTTRAKASIKEIGVVAAQLQDLLTITSAGRLDTTGVTRVEFSDGTFCTVNIDADEFKEFEASFSSEQGAMAFFNEKLKSRVNI